MSAEVSVIITSFQVAPYLRATVLSALSQSNVTLEVIVVDDASRDGSIETIRDLVDPRLRIIELPHNLGPSAARNVGIEHARGLWLAVLDGDDQFLPCRLSHLLTIGNAQQADIVVDNLEVFREIDGKNFPMFSSEHFGQLHHLSLARLIEEVMPDSGNFTLGYLKPLFRTHFLKTHAIRYDTDLRIGEDYMMLAECLALGAICVVSPETGYRYTVRSGSISHRLKPNDLRRMMAADEAFLSRHSLDAHSLVAARRRRKRREVYLAYLLLVDAIKARKMFALLCLIFKYPTSLVPLWEPLMKRIR